MIYHYKKSSKEGKIELPLMRPLDVAKIIRGSEITASRISIFNADKKLIDSFIFGSEPSYPIIFK